MTIDEAIQILSQASHQGIIAHDKDWREALELGLEALKWIPIAKKAINSLVNRPLPGEALD